MYKYRVIITSNLGRVISEPLTRIAAIALVTHRRKQGKAAYIAAFMPGRVIRRGLFARQG